MSLAEEGAAGAHSSASTAHNARLMVMLRGTPKIAHSTAGDVTKRVTVGQNILGVAKGVPPDHFVRLHQSDILLMTLVVTLQRGLPRRAASAQMASLRFLRDDALLHDVTFSFSDGEVRGAHRCVLAYQSPPMWKTSSDLGQLALRRPPKAPVVLYCRRPQALASLVQWSFRPCSPRHTTCFPHRSPVFRAMFDVNSPLQAARLIPLAEKSSSEFDLLLEYCYSCDSKLVTTQTAAPLLMLAEEYQVRKAKALAGSRLARSQEMP